MGSVPEEVALGFGGLAGDLREVYESGRTRDLEWRRSQLRGLVRLLEDKEENIFDALREDLGKHRAESFRDEVAFPFLPRCSNFHTQSFVFRPFGYAKPPSDYARPWVQSQVGVLKKSVVDKLRNLKNWAAPEKASSC